MKVWDCVTYWRESALAEARLRLWRSAGMEVTSVAFVGDRTHRGRRFTWWPRPPEGYRVERVELDADDTWSRERQQRDAVLRLRPEMADDDLVLLCDVDELVDPAALWPIVIGTEQSPACLAMTAFVGGLRFRSARRWTHAKACRASALPNHPSEELRLRFDWPIIPRAGWHLTYFGDADDRDIKLRAFAHQEMDTDQHRVELARLVQSGDDDHHDEPLTGPLRAILDDLGR